MKNTRRMEELKSADSLLGRGRLRESEIGLSAGQIDSADGVLPESLLGIVCGQPRLHHALVAHTPTFGSCYLKCDNSIIERHKMAYGHFGGELKRVDDTENLVEVASRCGRVEDLSTEFLGRVYEEDGSSCERQACGVQLE